VAAGAALDPARGEALRAVLAARPGVLAIEDDYVASSRSWRR
jgi:hypothetical protein